MNHEQALEVLRQLKNPFTDRLSTYRGIAGAMNYRFRGAELGQIIFSVKEDGYIGNRKSSGTEIGRTCCAPDLAYAINRALKDSDPNIQESDPGYEGYGRINPVTGEKIPGYGIPCIIAIDITPYGNRMEDIGCLANIAIFGPVNPQDIVLLFDHEVNYFPQAISQVQLDSFQDYAAMLQRRDSALQIPFDISELLSHQLAFLLRANARTA